jgi:hypothetical protein
MTFTYEDPPLTAKDEVRFWSGDTSEKVYSVSDESIGYLLAELDGNVKLSASYVADRIADYWAQSTSAGGSKSVGPFSTNQREAADMEAAWRKRAERLRAGGPAGPVIGDLGAIWTGTSTPEFTVGMMDSGVQRYAARDRDQPAPLNGVW